MDANYENRFRSQALGRLERLDRGLAKLYTLIKRGENEQALNYMDNDFKDLYVSLEDII